MSRPSGPRGLAAVTQGHHQCALRKSSHTGPGWLRTLWPPSPVISLYPPPSLAARARQGSAPHVTGKEQDQRPIFQEGGAGLSAPFYRSRN